jgi:histidinol-phosphate aminotransferase
MDRFFDLVTEPARAAGPQTKSTPERSSTSLIKLNANESVYGPSPKAVAAMRSAVQSSHLYPDNDSLELRQKLAQAHGVSPEQVLVSNGTTALLGVIARTLLRPGLNAITSARSFISYPDATQAAGAKLIEVPTLQNGFDLEGIAKAIDADTRVVFIANPNNPTGTLADAAAITRFLDRVPPHVITVLDEAYSDYAQFFAAKRGTDYSHSVEYVHADRNVLVLRTFSKVHGLAGVRVGYALGPSALVGYLARVQDLFAISSLAQAAAMAALGDQEHTQQALTKNAEQAAWMEKALGKLGYAVIPTWTNFIAIEVGQDARDFARRLRRRGVLVRPLVAWGAPSHIRVTLGLPEQNEMFLSALAAEQT